MTLAPLLYALNVWISLISFSKGTGFMYQFHGVTVQRANSEQSAITAPPGSASSNQLRNWCQYTVSKTVTCQVHNGTETSVQRVFQGCRWPGPCTKLISYRTLVRPSYKVAYRQVTALEWRCCPGFIGEECREECMNCTGYTDMNSRLNIIEFKIKQLEWESSSPPPVNRLPVGSTDNEVDTAQPTPIGPPSYLQPETGGRGPLGPVGPPGIPGLPGLTGPVGEAGTPGQPGPTGPKGARGFPGEAGLQGPPGPPGPPGPLSSSIPLRGDMFQLEEQEIPLPPTLPEHGIILGPPGPSGPAGPPGPPGPVGQPGFPGIPGHSAEGGVQGKPGDLGPKGDKGERGLPGLTGEQGQPGQPGPPGQKGEAGEGLPEGEGVQQLREALKILAERVLILEHMIGIHESPVESGSGLGGLPDPLPFPASKTKRLQPIRRPLEVTARQRRGLY